MTTGRNEGKAMTTIMGVLGAWVVYQVVMGLAAAIFCGGPRMDL